MTPLSHRWLRHIAPRVLSLVLIASLTLPARLAARPQEPPSAGPGGVAERVVLRPAAGRRGAVVNVAARLGLKRVRDLGRIGWIAFEADSAALAASAAKTLSAAGLVEAATADVRCEVAAPNDPRYAEQWALENTGQEGGTPGADINAKTAWAVSEGTTDVVVAILDTGTQVNHADLSANKWVNPREVPGNRIDDDENGFIDDVNGWDFLNRDATVYDPGEMEVHGTHVAGIIGAVADNSIGVAGVARRVRLMAVKFLSQSSGGWASDAAAGMIYAVDNGARVVNCSFSGPDSPVLRSAVRYAASRGVVVVAAAGNDRADLERNPVYPASINQTNVVTVAATTRTDDLAGFSSYGSETVDIAAPGDTVLSTWPNGYRTLSGTSMATPHVAGALALLMSQSPRTPPGELVDVILTTAKRLPSLSGKVRTGARLDLGAAALTWPPRPPSGLAANATPNGTSLLSWTDPPDPDWGFTRVVRKTGGVPGGPEDGVVIAETREGRLMDSGLLHGVHVGYALFAKDIVGNWSEGCTATVVGDDLVAPSGLEALSAWQSGMDVELRAAYPSDPDIVRVRGVRSARGPVISIEESDALVVVDSPAAPMIRDVAAALDTETVLHYGLWTQDASGNRSGITTLSVEVDGLPPQGSFVLQGGASVVVSRFVSADSEMRGAIQMRFDMGAGYGPWVGYAPTYLLRLPSYGIRTINVQYRDTAGNVATRSDTIIALQPPQPLPVLPALDPPPAESPQVIPVGRLTLADGGAAVATLTVLARSAVSKATQMRFDAGSGFGEWAPFAEVAPVRLTPGDGVRVVRAQYRSDTGGMMSAEATVVVDTQPPSVLAPVVVSVSAARVVVGLTPPVDGAIVRVWRSSAGGAWAVVATASADAARFLDERPPAGAVSYRVTAEDAAGNASAPSAVVSVVVRRSTRLRVRHAADRSTRITLLDEFGEPLANRRVVLQRRTATGFKTLASVTTGADGTAKARLRLARTSYVRAVFGGQPAFRASRSESVRIRP